MCLEIVFILLLGLVLGSFYNVLALRTLKGEKLVLDRSRCPNCSQQLLLLDMIPILSYLIYRGECRYCRSKISPIYLFGEIFTPLAFLLIYRSYDSYQEIFLQFVFISIIIISSISDLEKKIVPDRFIITGIILVLSIRIYYGMDPFNYMISGLISFLILYIFFYFSKKGLGGADVKIYALIGLSLGFEGALVSLFYASVLGLIYFFIRYLKGDNIKGLKIPFLPFIMGAILLIYILNI